MRLPHPDTLPDHFASFEVTDPAQRQMLERASRSQVAALEAEALGKPLSRNVLDRAEWQAAEAFWIAVGYLTPVFCWPWRDLDRLVGPVLPGEVWVVGARTGDGKSTFIANLIRLVFWGRENPRPDVPSTRATIAPLEQSPAVFKLKTACLALGFSIPAVFRQEWWRIPGGREVAEPQVRQAVADQGVIPLRNRVHYWPAETMDRDGLTAVVREAADFEHGVVVIDHIHQMDHGDGPENRGIRETMRLAKRLARQHDLAVVFTAQIGRGDTRDRRRKFYPPDLTDLQGASAIEQGADGVLLLYQPLAAGIRVKDIDEVLTGAREYRSVFKPNTMAALCGKHRLDGTARHQAVELRYDDGQITDLVPSWRDSPPDGVTLLRDAAPLERGDAYEPLTPED